VQNSLRAARRQARRILGFLPDEFFRGSGRATPHTDSKLL
jgi:hypothetical protein